MEKSSKEIKKIMPLYSFIHSSAYIDPSTKIGNGVVVLPGCVIDKGCVIEDNVLMNAGVVIAHDSKVKEHSFFGPGVKNVFYPKNDKSIVHHYFLANGHKNQTIENRSLIIDFLLINSFLLFTFNLVLFYTLFKTKIE